MRRHRARTSPGDRCYQAALDGRRARDAAEKDRQRQIAASQAKRDQARRAQEDARRQEAEAQQRAQQRAIERILRERRAVAPFIEATVSAIRYEARFAARALRRVDAPLTYQESQYRGWVFDVRDIVENVPIYSSGGYAQMNFDSCSVNVNSEPTVVGMQKATVGRQGTLLGRRGTLFAFRQYRGTFQHHELSSDELLGGARMPDGLSIDELLRRASRVTGLQARQVDDEKSRRLRYVREYVSKHGCVPEFGTRLPLPSAVELYVIGGTPTEAQCATYVEQWRRALEDFCSI